MTVAEHALNSKLNSELKSLAHLVNTSESEQNSSTVSRNHTLEQLDYHGISLLAQQNDAELSNEVVSSLGSRQKMMVANELLKQQALKGLFHALYSHGLTHTLIIKGTALAYSVYPDPWLRPRSDTDIIIEQSELSAHEAVFTQLGFTKQFAIEGDLLSYQSTWSKQLTENVSLHIDCHWRLSNRQILASVFSFEELLVDSVTATTLNDSNLIPSKINSLFIAALHRVGHHANEERLIWLYDMHLLASAFSHEDWSEFCRVAKQKAITSICLEALLSCQALFSTNVPSNAIEELRIFSNKNTEKSAYFLNRECPEWRVLLYDMKGLSGIKNKLRFVKENLFPSAHYLKEQMNTNSILYAYFLRLLSGIRRLSK